MSKVTESSERGIGCFAHPTTERVCGEGLSWQIRRKINHWIFNRTLYLGRIGIETFNGPLFSPRDRS